MSPMIIEHGYRSYIFGRALGTADGIECDPEALFAATMLHDYALEIADSLTDRCFTVAGAEVAEQVLVSSPLDSSLRHDVLDAITLHLNPRVPSEHGAVQHLAHDGILLDVLGARRNQLDRQHTPHIRPAPTSRFYRSRYATASGARPPCPMLPCQRTAEGRLWPCLADESLEPTGSRGEYLRRERSMMGSVSRDRVSSGASMASGCTGMRAFTRIRISTSATAGRPRRSISMGGSSPGALAPRALGLVAEWAALHRVELFANWGRARREEALETIAPLP